MSGEDVRSTRHPVIYLLLILIVVFLGFALIGPLIGFLITKPYVPGTFEDYLNALQNLSEHPELKIQVYVLQGCSTLVGLIIAPILMLSTQKKNISEFFGLNRLQVVPVIVTVFIVITFMLVNSVFIAWNANLHFPEFMRGFEEWAKAKEKLAEETTRMLTQFDSIGELMLAILVIALLPAIGYFVSTRSFPSPKSWWIEYQFGITAKDSAGKRLRKHAWPTLIRRTLALPRLLFTRGSSAPRG